MHKDTYTNTYIDSHTHIHTQTHTHREIQAKNKVNPLNAMAVTAVQVTHIPETRFSQWRCVSLPAAPPSHEKNKNISCGVLHGRATVEGSTASKTATLF